MRTLASALVFFLAATAVVQAHVPTHCATTFGATSNAFAGLSASKANQND